MVVHIADDDDGTSMMVMITSMMVMMMVHIDSGGGGGDGGDGVSDYLIVFCPKGPNQLTSSLLHQYIFTVLVKRTINDEEL